MLRAGVKVSKRLLSTLAILGLVSLTVSGCVEHALTALPRGIQVDVYQNRIDYSEHKLEVAVANTTDSPFDVLSLSFASPAFSPATYYRKAPTTVRPGTTTDLRLLLPPSQCDALSSRPTVEISFSYQGQSGSASVSPNDRMNQLESITREDCRGAAVAAVATMTSARALKFTTIDGQRAAVMDFTAIPIGDKGKLTIESVRGTVLVGAWDPASKTSGNTVPLGIDVGDSNSPVSFSVTLLPARCDPHVALEDKRGTFFTFLVTTTLDTGPIFIGVNDDVRVEIYDFVSESCGWD